MVWHSRLAGCWWLWPYSAIQSSHPRELISAMATLRVF